MNFLFYVPLIETTVYTTRSKDRLMIYSAIISKHTVASMFTFRAFCQPNCLKAHSETRNSLVPLYSLCFRSEDCNCLTPAIIFSGVKSSKEEEV